MVFSLSRDLAKPMIKGSCDFIGKAPIKGSYHPVKFVDHRHFDGNDIGVLVCHVISQDHIIKGSCDFMGRSQSREVTILPNLIAISTLIVDI